VTGRERARVDLVNPGIVEGKGVEAIERLEKNHDTEQEKNNGKGQEPASG
jgi:hypothetical protein